MFKLSVCVDEVHRPSSQPHCSPHQIGVDRISWAYALASMADCKDMENMRYLA